MSEQLLVRHCSPTLAGMKTGNIFSCRYQTADDVKQFVRTQNQRLRKKGLRMIPLRYLHGRVLIYVYRPALLKQDLLNPLAYALLAARGYTPQDPQQCIMHLMERLRDNADGEFPHEIGLFLGYPPEDVQGFIENKPDSCLFCGTWKVYGNADEAKRLFAKYKKCTNVYCDHWSRGKSLERLTVG